MKNDNTNATKTEETKSQLQHDYRQWAIGQLASILSTLVIYDCTSQQTLELLYQMLAIIVDAHSDALTVAEDASFTLFRFTPEHDTASDKWTNAVLQGGEIADQLAGFNNRRRELHELNKSALQAEADTKPPVESSPVLQQTDFAPETKADIQEHHLEIWANKLAYVLRSDDVSGEIKFALGNIFSDAANEVGLHIDDPSLIKPAFTAFMRKAGEGYGKGILHSIQTIIGDLEKDTLEGELEQFEILFNPPPEKPAPLDLSNCAPDQLYSDKEKTSSVFKYRSLRLLRTEGFF